MDTPEFSDGLRTLSTHQTFEYFAMSGDTQLSSDTTATDTVFVSGESLEGSSDAQFGEKFVPDTGGADIWKVTLGFLLLLGGLLVSRKPWKGVLARS
jgi:hypothetical protein